MCYNTHERCGNRPNWAVSGLAAAGSAVWPAGVWPALRRAALRAVRAGSCKLEATSWKLRAGSCAGAGRRSWKFWASCELRPQARRELARHAWRAERSELSRVAAGDEPENGVSATAGANRARTTYANQDRTTKSGAKRKNEETRRSKVRSKRLMCWAMREKRRRGERANRQARNRQLA